MKLLHIGDLHLGKSLVEFDLSEDQKYILDQILNIAEESKVDAVLIAGMFMIRLCQVRRLQSCWIIS